MKNPPQKPGWRSLVAFCLAAAAFSFAIRYVVFMRSGLDPAMLVFPDELNYYLPAAKLIREEGIGFFYSARSLWNGPLNPAWIALFDGDIPLIKVTNLFCISIGSGLLAGSIARRLGFRWGWVGALLMLLYYPAYSFGPTILTEPLYLSLLEISMAIILLGGGEFAWISAGIMTGIATLVRPTTQLLPFWILCASPFLRKENRRIFLLHALASFAVTLPVLVHNYRTFDFRGIANGFGAVFYLGNDFRRDGDEPVYSGVDFDTYKLTKPSTHLDTEGDRILVAAALARIEAHPATFVRLTCAKVFRYLFGSPDAYFYPYGSAGQYLKHSKPFESAATAVWIVIQVTLSLSTLAMIFMGPSNMPAVYAGWVFAYFTALHALTFPIPRLFLPLLPYTAAMTAEFLATSRGRHAWRFVTSVCGICILLILLRGKGPFPTEADASKLQLFEKRAAGAFASSHDANRAGEYFKIAGKDPYLVFALPGIPMTRTQVVGFNLEIHCDGAALPDGDGQLFWSNEAEPHFSEPKSLHFRLRAKSGARILTPALNFEWNGTLRWLRLDLPQDFAGCEVREPSVEVLE